MARHLPKGHPIKNRDNFLDVYLFNSTTATAKHFGVHDRTVRNLAKKHGVYEHDFTRLSRSERDVYRQRHQPRHAAFSQKMERLVLAAGLADENHVIISNPAGNPDIDTLRITSFFPFVEEFHWYEKFDDAIADKLERTARLMEAMSAGRRKYAFHRDEDMLLAQVPRVTFANLDLECALTPKLKNQVLDFIANNSVPGTKLTVLLNTTSRGSGEEEERLNRWRSLVQQLKNTGYEIVYDDGVTNYITTSGKGTMSLFGIIVRRHV
jgi:hypothetical protein